MPLLNVLDTEKWDRSKAIIDLVTKQRIEYSPGVNRLPM